MISTARIIVSLWASRWRALREDEGASTVEYTILVGVGIVVALIVAGLVRQAVTNHSGDIH